MTDMLWETCARWEKAPDAAIKWQVVFKALRKANTRVLETLLSKERCDCFCVQGEGVHNHQVYACYQMYACNRILSP
jgi:hypothetical protein